MCHAGSWESIGLYDHFHTFANAFREATYEARTLMPAIAASTSHVRLGQMCTLQCRTGIRRTGPRSAPVDIVSGWTHGNGRSRQLSRAEMARLRIWLSVRPLP